MNAARRNANRRGWPRGLYEPREGYFVWRHPDGRTIPIGRVSLQGAKAQAAAANLKVESMAPSLLDKMAPAPAEDGQTVEALLGKIPPAAAANTRRSHKSLDKRIVAAIGSMQAADLRTQHCAELVEPIEAVEKKARLALAVRSRLVTMCQRGMQLGWMTSNPAEATRTPAVTVKRRRLSLDDFRAVRAKADEVNGWIGKAMDLALVTGSDRDTLSGLMRSNIVGDCLEFQRGKTGVRIAIPLDLELVVAGLVLREVLRNTSGVASRYIVHHVRNFGNAPAGSPVFVDTITKAFAKAYQLAELPPENAPTFHEIRSLSKRLYKAQGNVDTKELLGHQDEKTAALYADPRGSEAIRVTVQPLDSNKRQVNTK
jgi:enterobacteria phage integrase